MYALLLAAVLLPFLAGSSAAQEKPVTVVLVGDSTVTDDAGWGRAFAARFNDSGEGP